MIYIMSVGGLIDLRGDTFQAWDRREVALDVSGLCLCKFMGLMYESPRVDAGMARGFSIRSFGREVILLVNLKSMAKFTTNTLGVIVYIVNT